MGPNHRVEAGIYKGGHGSSRRLTDFEAKTVSRHGSSASSSSPDSSQDLGKSEYRELKPPTSSRVSFVSSNEQVPGGYVPDRIPSSIFSSKPATPMDWSTASNESLFSIHVGNGSFSKDQFFMFYKSGELTKLDEQIIAQGNVLPPLKELEDMAARNEKIDKGSGATEMSKKATMVAEASEVAEDHSQQKIFPAEVHNSPNNSVSRLSDASNNSTLSFAFPMLTGTDAGRFISANGDQNNKGLQTQSTKQRQQQKQKQKQSTEILQPQSPVTPQNASSRSWFSWFYCCRCS